jgi:pimeloyl-ACP methyl ester carboxylesterase
VREVDTRVEDSAITLADGRKLAYAQYGDPAGVPVLYFHGSPSSRFEPLLVGEEALRAHGLRVIAPDRPGMGASDFLPGRGFSDWPRDVVALADALGLDRFCVLGFSGGGPYAAVCAARIPQCLGAAVIVSGGWNVTWPEATEGLPLPNRIFFALARRALWLLALILKLMVATSTGDVPEKELEGLRKRVPPSDFEALREPRRMEAMNRIIRSSLQQGTRGARDFGFGPEEIRAPVTLFHGAQDANAPIALARRLAASMPGATLVIHENEAHMSMLCSRFDEIAGALRA